jgi:hypothetical protein
MKLRSLTRTEARDLLVELRRMADLAPGPAPKSLSRAKEIRFQLQGQTWVRPYLADKVDSAYRDLQVLLSARRWRDVSSIEALRHEIKAACARAKAGLERRAGAV